MLRLLSRSVFFAMGALFVACSGDDPAATTREQPAAQTPPTSLQETVAKVSAGAQKCLDMVNAQRYVEAVDACKAAMQDSANADVQGAYDEAVAAVEEQAKAAAVQAAAELLAGKDSGEAAKGALEKLGKGFVTP